MGAPKFEEARFHVNSGPPALFARVRQKLAGRRQLRLHAAHLEDRAASRNAPLAEISRFDAEVWQLLTVSVRTDTCRFINSAWWRDIGERRWLVVIGLHDTIQTVYPLEGDKQGPDIVKAGPLYERVAEVNAALLEGGV